ncbi:Hypothetical protein HVR_LOCUS106 [uncultured virus]|nr:Hypothetical protein HVR_LOCUS106 [uncultured virus]
MNIYITSEQNNHQLTNGFISVDELAKHGDLPCNITDEQFAKLCASYYHEYSAPKGDNCDEWILGNMLGKLILLRREGKAKFLEKFCEFAKSFRKVKSQNLARICLRSGDGELYQTLKQYNLFRDVGVLPILACKTNNFTLVSALCQSCKGYNIRTDGLRDIFCCKSCDPHVFAVVQDGLTNEEIKHLFKFVKTAKLTEYLWITFRCETDETRQENKGNKRQILREGDLRDKINYSDDYPDIIEYIITQITDRNQWRPLNSCARLEGRGYYDLAQRLRNTFDRDPPC